MQGDPLEINCYNHHLGDNSMSIFRAIVTVAGVVIIIAGMKAAVSILVPFLLAAFIATTCAPALISLSRRGLPEGASLFLIISGVLIIGFLIVVFLGSSIRDFTRDLPEYEANLKQQINKTLMWLKTRGVDTTAIESMNLLDVGSVMRLTAVTLNNLSEVLANGFLILMIVIFILLEASSFPVKLQSIKGDQYSNLSHLDQVLNTINHYMAIKTVVSLATAVVVALWLLILGVNYPLLWGLLAFLLNYVPNIGSIIAAIPAVLLALIQLGALSALATAGGYLAVNMIMGNFVEPRFMGKGLGLSTLVVFLSLLFWGWVLGPVGMLLSVPLTIVVKIVLECNDETRWLAILLGR
jgi:predicted PurR-regulated permease PerM